MGLNMVGASVIVPDGSDGTDPENPYADGKKWTDASLKNRIAVAETESVEPKLFKGAGANN